MQIVVVCEGKKKPQPLPPSRNAGLSSIRVALGSNARVMTDMAAGSSFKETTRLEETRGVREIISKDLLCMEINILMQTAVVSISVTLHWYSLAHLWSSLH